MTSPPYALLTKKEYGNENSENYLNWFRPFAEAFHKALRDTGSLVIDIGGTWEKGYPVRSLYHFELLIMLCKEYGFYLAQEHYWWNPAKMPTPIEWVNRQRIRVKDAVNCVWWLSKTPRPKANNKKVLAPYKSSQKRLMKKGYKSNVSRPSEHKISDKWGADNGGAIPPNLLAIPNTASQSSYHKYCKKHKIKRHPARFPEALPEYFIRMLTDPGDIVLDPFAGSCTTGYVAEKLKRRWYCCDLTEKYLKGALGRFPYDSEEDKPNGKFSWGFRSDAIQIAPPCWFELVETVSPKEDNEWEQGEIEF